VQRAIKKAIADTETNSGLSVTIAFDYGSRAELVRAARRAMTSGVVTPQSIQENLYDPEMPPVDLLVRTSGEARISNFLLWQIKGAHIFFTERPWPDFDRKEFNEALASLPNMAR
jgi:undecaprenyl diphosphate synthase